MSTLNDRRQDINVNTKRSLTEFRKRCGDDLHEMACLGGIDGCAGALAEHRGPEHAAMALYSAADALIMQMPAKAIALPYRSRLARLRQTVRQYDAYTFYAMGIAVGFITGWFA